ncbi:MAG: ABC transporter ATP-binding protein [Spirochaetaceae bacterium]|nr:ABC transporter ATP-binding protein [Spirochaetaceae bacterium]
MFNLENISKTYAKAHKKAVSDLTLTINNGEIFGFLGPNGAGKTTTIKLLTGILTPDEGSITVDGFSLKDDPINAKKQISFVPDTPETFSKLKASEYINFIADVYGVPTNERQNLIKEYAEMFGISDVLKAPISSFSHGMKQKLFLTASLVTDPDNWILDEPMVGLDPESAFKLKELMRARAAAGKTVFFSTHVMEVAEKLCDRIGIIKQGKIVFCGTQEELKAQHGGAEKTLEQIFLELTAEPAESGE